MGQVVSIGLIQNSTVFTMNKILVLVFLLLVVSGCLLLYTSNIAPTLYWTFRNEDQAQFNEFVSDIKSGRGKTMTLT